MKYKILNKIYLKTQIIKTISTNTDNLSSKYLIDKIDMINMISKSLSKFVKALIVKRPLLGKLRLKLDVINVITSDNMLTKNEELKSKLKMVQKITLKIEKIIDKEMEESFNIDLRDLT